MMMSVETIKNKIHQALRLKTHIFTWDNLNYFYIGPNLENSYGHLLYITS